MKYLTPPIVVPFVLAVLIVGRILYHSLRWGS
jgi:hypothetical protein